MELTRKIIIAALMVFLCIVAIATVPPAEAITAGTVWYPDATGNTHGIGVCGTFGILLTSAPLANTEIVGRGRAISWATSSSRGSEPKGAPGDALLKERTQVYRSPIPNDQEEPALTGSVTPPW